MQGQIKGPKQHQIEMKNNLAILNILTKDEKERKYAQNPEIEQVQKRYKSVGPSKSKLKARLSPQRQENKSLIMVVKYLVVQEKDRQRKVKILEREKRTTQMKEQISNFIIGERNKAIKEIFSFY